MGTDRESKEDKEMMAALAKLSPAAQEHFKHVVRLIAFCYTDTEHFSGLLVVKDPDSTSVLALNANEMDAAEIIIEASNFISKIVTHDAPPREKFN